MRLVGPDTGQAIGLQFLAHQQAIVAFHALTALACGLHAGRHPQQGLHVVADFVGNHIGLGKVAGGGKALLHLLEELHVQVHHLIGRAIEGAGG
ncbi:hypothetical protein D3C81_1853050 [compost metagenome]